ncbi:MAG: hypothetical protein WC836_16635 [Desulfobacula sp.]|jgi:hypothetical protein
MDRNPGSSFLFSIWVRPDKRGFEKAFGVFEKIGIEKVNIDNSAMEPEKFKDIHLMENSL